MGLFLGILIIVLGFIGSLFIGFANGMSDAPSASNSISIWPWFIGCLIAGGFFIYTHFYPLHW